MKFNLFALFFALSVVVIAPSFAEEEFADCGPGWVMVDNGSLDGVVSQKCEKLWCHDLESDRVMGSGNTANSGYVITANPVLMESADGESIECFGERKWCSGEIAGRWNPEYGAYTKQGEDSIQYVSSQRGDCFTWGAGAPKSAGCSDGQIPVLVNGKWSCSGKKTGLSVNFGQKPTTAGAFHRGATLKKK